MDPLTPAHIQDVVLPTVDTLMPDESVTLARRRMESFSARSALVVEANRPVGIVRWRALLDQPGETVLRAVMDTTFPSLRLDMTLAEAQQTLTDVPIDVDVLPVVDADGALLGQVARRQLATPDPAVRAAPLEQESAQRQLARGMTVIGSDARQLGVIEAVDRDPQGTLRSMTVKYGLLGRHAKRVPADIIQQVEGDQVRVHLSHADLKLLPDAP